MSKANRARRRTTLKGAEADARGAQFVSIPPDRMGYAGVGGYMLPLLVLPAVPDEEFDLKVMLGIHQDPDQPPKLCLQIISEVLPEELLYSFGPGEVKWVTALARHRVFGLAQDPGADAHGKEMDRPPLWFTLGARQVYAVTEYITLLGRWSVGRIVASAIRDVDAARTGGEAPRQ